MSCARRVLQILTISQIGPTSVDVEGAGAGETAASEKVTEKLVVERCFLSIILNMWIMINKERNGESSHT